MQRRKLLKTVLAGTALTPFVAQQASAAMTPAISGFDQARWASANQARLEAVIAQFGNKSAHYNKNKRPYVVFDWDNTCIMNDCEEALFMYQINHLAFNLTPEEFDAIVRLNLADQSFKKEAGYATIEGNPIRVKDIADDVSADYRWLMEARKAGKSLAELQQTAQFEDFRAKLYFMYDAIGDTFDTETSYKWVIYFFANMTPAEVQQMTRKSNDAGLGDALRKVKYQSPLSLPGKAGVVACSHFHGLRIHEEMRALMHTLRANGIDVYVSTASLDDVVRVFAGDATYGYGVPPENVIGLRLEMQDGKYQAVYRKGWHFNWGPGKTVGIRSELQSKKGYGPLIVLGDSDGDAWMLRDFEDTQVGVIVNRLKKGEIGANSQKAAQGMGTSKPRFVLQGRNEHTGIMIPDEKTLKFGKDELKLLA